MKINCAYCGKVFNRSIGRVNANKKLSRKNYCSKECQNKAHSKRVFNKNHPGYKGGLQITKCDCCGEKFKRWPSQIKEENYCSKECGNKGMSKTRKKLGLSKDKKNPMWGKRGKDHPRWKEDKSIKSTEIRKIRGTIRYRRNREYIFKRDKVCVKCGSDKRLELDHTIPLKENIKLAYDPDNCQILCRECHKNTSTFGGKRNNANC